VDKRVHGGTVRPMCRPCHMLEESIATNYRGEMG
jgi:hypothetical protein